MEADDQMTPDDQHQRHLFEDHPRARQPDRGDDEGVGGIDVQQLVGAAGADGVGHQQWPDQQSEDQLHGLPAGHAQMRAPVKGDQADSEVQDESPEQDDAARRDCATGY